MKRCACVAFLSIVGTVCVGASRAQAQTPPSAAPAPKLSIELATGPTLGTKSAAFVAAEIGWRLTDKVDLFIEGGHMTNVGTTVLETNAAKIANFLAASVGSTGISVNHADIGIKFNLTPPNPKVHPYVLVGAGIAKATTEVTFTVNGAVIDPTDRVSLGGDLSGTNTKTLLMFGGGITFPFANNYFADFGYRFGGILSKVSDIENDTTIKTQRVMLGVGVRF